MSINVEIPLADRFAAAKAALDAAQEAMDAVKAEVKALGMPVIEGLTCTLKYDLISQMRVDQSLIPADIKEAAKREIVVERITVKAKGVK